MARLIASPDFAQRARHPDHPKAFTRQRSLPLPALIAALLTMRGGSQQTLLDGFVGALAGSTQFLRGVSDRAFAQARARLHMPALNWLNDQLLARVQTLVPVARWQGLRVVAGDASVLMPALRACHRTRGLTPPDQRLFALYLADALGVTVDADILAHDVLDGFDGTADGHGVSEKNRAWPPVLGAAGMVGRVGAERQA